MLTTQVGLPAPTGGRGVARGSYLDFLPRGKASSWVEKSVAREGAVEPQIWKAFLHFATYVLAVYRAPCSAVGVRESDSPVTDPTASWD